MSWFSDLTAAAHKLDPEHKKNIVRYGAGVAVLLVLVVVFFLGYAATGEAGSPLVLARLGIGYTLAAIALFILLVALVLLVYLWLGKTRIGKRLTVWVLNSYGAPTEPAEVQAMKTLNSGILLAALLIAAALLFAGILR